jgi:hypothetical protein
MAPSFLNIHHILLVMTIPAGSIELENDQNVAYFKYNNWGGRRSKMI